MSSGSEPRERVRTLLLRGDNQLKGGRPERALAAFEEARTVAASPGFEAEVRELVERRIESLRTLIAGASGSDAR